MSDTAGSRSSIRITGDSDELAAALKSLNRGNLEFVQDSDGVGDQAALESPAEAPVAPCPHCAAKDQDLQDAARALQSTEAELGQWQNGERHLPVDVMLQHFENCPTCKPIFEPYLESYHNQRVLGMPLDEAKKIARQHKLWPPPDIEINLPAGLLHSRMRS